MFFTRRSPRRCPCQPREHPPAPGQVAGPHRGVEAEPGIVGQGHGLFLGPKATSPARRGQRFLRSSPPWRGWPVKMTGPIKGPRAPALRSELGPFCRASSMWRSMTSFCRGLVRAPMSSSMVRPTRSVLTFAPPGRRRTRRASPPAHKAVRWPRTPARRWRRRRRRRPPPRAQRARRRKRSWGLCRPARKSRGSGGSAAAAMTRRPFRPRRSENQVRFGVNQALARVSRPRDQRSRPSLGKPARWKRSTIRFPTSVDSSEGFKTTAFPAARAVAMGTSDN
jgi:hypothetical protein